MSGLEKAQEKRFHGVPVSAGVARGSVFLHNRDDDEPPVIRIDQEDVPEEIARFEAALIATRAQILEMQQKIAEQLGAKDAGIFDAHLLVVEDQTLIDEVLRNLERDLFNVEHVFHEVAARYCKTLSQIDDPYLRERALDIQDVAGRVIRNLLGKSGRTLTTIDHACILIAHNLTPGDTAQMNRQHVLAMATDQGNRTSHTAIMARSMNLPAVVGLHDITAHLKSGDQVLVDGSKGLVILNPDDRTLWEYGELEVKRSEVEEHLTELKETASTTKDGRHVILSANIELAQDVDLVMKNGAEGVGLYRTEFFYLNRNDLPSEEDQYETYRKVAEAVLPHGMIIRTLDLGGDKFIGSLQLPEEINPFLGWRAIRFCLEKVDIFKTQLRAILRASAVGNVRMMYPMISGLDELRKANAILEECKQELRERNQPFNENLEVGAMIEVPSAAMIADLLARECKFFSIGTNDLIQYSIAVDRVNERIAALYEPTHPAIVRLIKMVVDAAHAKGIWVGVCGEMAGEVLFAPLLVGLGVDELSAGAGLVPRIKHAVQTLNYEDCKKLVEDVLNMEAGSEILERCEKMARELYGELLV